MAKTYRVAIIGSTGRGDYGHGIDVAWKEVPQAEIVALADDDEKGRGVAVERTGAKTAYADYREMIEKEKPQIVSICQRWIDRHHEMIMACVERGIHVFMEKPFCRTLAEADQIVRTCEMTHSKLAIAHQTRYCPTIPAVKRLIDEGKLGTILEMRARGKEDARGGAEDLWVLGSHLMNLMQVFAAHRASPPSPARESRLRSETSSKGTKGWDRWPEIPSLPSISFRTASRDTSPHGAQEGKPSRFALQIYGSKGVVEYLTGYLPPVSFLADSSWSPGRSGAKWQKVTSGGVGVPEPIKAVGIPNGNVAAVQDLIAAVEEDRQPLCSVYEARAIIEMIMAVFESQRQGKPVALPLENRKHPLTMLT